MASGKKEFSGEVELGGVNWALAIMKRRLINSYYYTYTRSDDAGQRFKSKKGLVWKDHAHWRTKSKDITTEAQATIDAAVPEAIKEHLKEHLKAYLKPKAEEIEKAKGTEEKKKKAKGDDGADKKKKKQKPTENQKPTTKGTKKKKSENTKKKALAANKTDYLAAIRSGAKRIGLFIKDGIDTLIGIAIALGLAVLLNPFYQLAHSTHRLVESTKALAKSDSNIVLRSVQVFFNVILRVVLLPVQFVLNALYSVPEALYRAVKGGVYGFKGLHIGLKGSIPGVLALPFVNINWKHKKGANGRTHLGYTHRLSGKVFSRPYSNDSYFFGTRDLLFLALIIGVLAGVAAVAVIVSTGVATPIVATVVQFIATNMSINLAAWSIPALGAVAFATVTTGAAIATTVVEAVLYGVTRGLYHLGNLLQAVPDKMAKREELKAEDLEMLTVGASKHSPIKLAGVVNTKSNEGLSYHRPPVNLFGKLKAVVNADTETLNNYVEPGSAV